ncbi:Nitrilase family, member 2 [Seminavis robusta]|uniref:Nitrilase family, member 2 n=1 Tax=Seminavis robusta TaxID=568900 RepID=A0A9N8DNL7_9STRA|nr:Nitrilase family, member 2 [Seminavis robusta]|eukprot:Sro238_g095570.1 Nitrilase family, member 2 (348) ;mRNA; r:41625-42668
MSKEETVVEEPRLLPEDFAPSSNTVIIGRGKKIKAHEGNRRLFAIVRAELPTYSVCGCKNKKSGVLVRIVERVRDTNEGRVGFVKQDAKTGRWYEVTPFAARTNVAQAFRDTNHMAYKSSKQSKQRRRRRVKMTDPAPASPTSSTCSVQAKAKTATSIMPPPKAPSSMMMGGFQQDQVASASLVASSSTSSPTSLNTLMRQNMMPMTQNCSQLDALCSASGVGAGWNTGYFASWEGSSSTLHQDSSFGLQDDSLARLNHILDKASDVVDLPQHTCDSSYASEQEARATWGDLLEPVPIAEPVPTVEDAGLDKAFDDIDEEQLNDEDHSFEIFDVVTAADIRAAFGAQ